MLEIEARDLANAFGQIGRFAFDGVANVLQVSHALRKDQAELSKMPAQRVDRLGALTDEALMCEVGDSAGLMFGTLHGDIAHIRP